MPLCPISKHENHNFHSILYLEIMKISKIPPKDELLGYVHNKKAAAQKYCVTEKTITLWLSKYELYEPRLNYGCNKLNLDKAREIRECHKLGTSLKDLANLYHVTFSTISRIIHNITYHEETIRKEVADITMVYNPSMNPVSRL